MANNTFQAVTTIGYPESRILGQCAVYLATSPKVTPHCLAIGTAQQLVKQTGIFRFLFIYATPNKINESWDMVKNTNMLMITTIILLINFTRST
jgi:replication-associated recombination protein RarA